MRRADSALRPVHAGRYLSLGGDGMTRSAMVRSSPAGSDAAISLLAQAGQSFRPIHIIDVFTHDCSGYSPPWRSASTG